MRTVKTYLIRNPSDITEVLALSNRYPERAEIVEITRFVIMIFWKVKAVVRMVGGRLWSWLAKASVRFTPIRQVQVTVATSALRWRINNADYRKNRSTGEQLVLPLAKFKEKFKTEFALAYQNYIRHETEKNAFLPEFMQKHLTEAKFMLSFAWNFNNYSGSDWCIIGIR